MRIFAISDLHLDETNSKPMEIFDDVWVGHKKEILKSIKKASLTMDDCLIIAGDLSWAMKLDDATIDLGFLGEINTNILIVKGNHDYWWDTIGLVRRALPKNVYAIQNDSVKIGNFVFFGTRGWTVKENNNYSAEDQKIYDREVIRLKLSLESALKQKKDEDELIFITHFPPFNSKKEDNEFLKLLRENNVKTVVFGHLHGRYINCKEITQIGEINCYLTSCDFLKNNIKQIK